MTPRQPHPPTPESAPQSAETGETQSASAPNEKPETVEEPSASEDDDRVAAYLRGPTAFTA
ncbi:hypothetical protein [Microvirga subterranea]|uniref:Uncharacterized protein n=1 Tax=Microvirga subterranea TaxID=186651 RepID=A0A370HKY2_9HYPH|nr:hypothetical protein [Microvirga subterranea]RDI59178.1 hypothetical protein DES45_10489 [Microvirga subterranea]